MAEWYCRISGEEQGPLTASQLRTMVAEGRLAPGDALRQGGSGVWVPAASVKGLFGAAGALRGATRPATAPNEPGRREQPRPLLRAVPMEDEPAEDTLVPPPPSLLDRDDAGLDLAHRPSQLSTVPPQRAKGWRSTGLDFLADSPPISPRGPSVEPAAAGHRVKDTAEPIRRWTLPVLAGTLVLLLVVWLVVGQLRGLRSAGETPDGVASAPKTAAPKETAPKAGAKTIGPPPKPGQRGASEPAGVAWIDASGQPWKCDNPNVTITIRAVETVVETLREAFRAQERRSVDVAKLKAAILARRDASRSLNQDWENVDRETWTPTSGAGD
jgi:hypothetical protein